MFINQDYYIGYSSIGKDYYITNKGLLNFLEDTGGIHSTMAGTGILDIEKTNLTWVALHWILKVYDRPRYGDTIKVKTWTIDKTGQRDMRLYADRDFEVYNKDGKIIAEATSRWLMLDNKTKKIAKLTDDIKLKYQEETKRVWDNIEYKKLIEPKEYQKEISYKIDKRMIDFNHHVHNTNYLDFVDEIANDEYNLQMRNNLEILFKKEIKLGDTINIRQSDNNEEHVIVVKSEDDKNLHAIIKLS